MANSDIIQASLNELRRKNTQAYIHIHTHRHTYIHTHTGTHGHRNLGVGGRRVGREDMERTEEGKRRGK